MRTIYKYPVDIGDTTLIIPKAARVIHVAEQHGQVTLWIEQDLALEPEKRLFTVRGTGHSLHRDLIYVGTAHIRGYVWHLYEPLESETDS